MDESRARYISLIVIACVAFYMFFFLATMIISQDIRMQSIPDTRLSPAVVMFLLVFLVLGILIILSACFRPAFYLLTVVGAVLAVLLFMIPVSEFRALALVSLVPYAFYYVILVMNKVVPVKSR